MSTVQHCVNGAWGSEESCDADNICVQGECKPKCEIEGKTQCMGNAIYTCNGTTWNETPERTCDEGEICINNETCGCINGETDNIRLFEGKKQKCVDYKWTDIETICNPGTQKCSDDYIYKCDETGQWENAPTEHCEFGCSFREGECRQVECITDGPLCVDNRLFECNDNKPSYIANCEKDGICDSEQNKCRQVECITDGPLCVDNRLFECNDNKPSYIANCAKDGICDAEQNKCISCSEDEHKCENNKRYTCINGQWSNEESCGEGILCQSMSECGKCKEGSTECSNGKLRTCTNGIWDNGIACKNNASCNSDGTDCGECKDGTSTCRNKTNSNGTETGFYTVCRHGIKSSEPCDNNNACNSLETCGQCKYNEMTCDNNTLRKCINGTWTVIDEHCQCELDATTKQYTCSPIGGESMACSTEDAEKCEDGYKFVCRASIWSDKTLCPNNASCKSESECGDCIDGSTECKNGEIRTCTNGTWGEYENCPEGSATCRTATECGECSDQDTMCTNKGPKGFIKTCINGKWQNEILCDNNGASCKSDKATCGKCKNNTHKCENGPDSVGTFSTCTNGEWPPGVACNGASCKLDNTCGDCKDGSTECSNGKLRTCTNGVWDTGKPCENGASCSSNSTCGVCLNKSVECSNGILKTCNEGAWSQKPCDDNASCSTNTTCGECKNGSKKCENGEIKTCENGAWGESSPCPSGTCNSAKTECGCSEGQKQCSPNYTEVQMCTDGRWQIFSQCYGKQMCAISNNSYECILPAGSLCKKDDSNNYTFYKAENTNDPIVITKSTHIDCIKDNSEYVIIDTVSSNCSNLREVSTSMDNCINDCFDRNQYQIKESCPEECKIYPCPGGKWP